MWRAKAADPLREGSLILSLLCCAPWINRSFQLHVSCRSTVTVASESFRIVVSTPQSSQSSPARKLAHQPLPFGRNCGLASIQPWRHRMSRGADAICFSLDTFFAGGVKWRSEIETCYRPGLPCSSALCLSRHSSATWLSSDTCELGHGL